MTQGKLDNYYAVIMAGGGGTRLWPLSRKSNPKQMLQLIGEDTLFQMAVKRLEGLFPPERILVVTVEEQAVKLQAQAPQIPMCNFLLEPMPRGTASVVGLAAVAIKHRDPDGVMAVLTADHIIKGEQQFQNYLQAAHAAAEDGFLVTLGITPAFASTGYGYIQQGNLLGEYQGTSVYTVEQFREKPGKSQAEEMLASGKFVWNSGMFIWRVENILDEFRRQMLELYSSLQTIADEIGKAGYPEILNKIWSQIQPETIDYGIMEGAQQVASIPAKDLGWSDVGSWDALYDLLPADGSGNIIIGEDHQIADTGGTLVHGKQDERMIVTIGVNDLVIVDTDDVLLVCHKDMVQNVRQVVKNLIEDNKDTYL